MATLTFVGSAVSTTSAIDISGTGRQAGDFCVYIDWARDGGGTPASVTPTGFAAKQNDSNAFNNIRLSSKVLDGTEGSITGMNGGSANRKTCLIFRPSAPILTNTYTNSGKETTNNNPTLITIDPTAQSQALLIGSMGSSSAVSPRSTSPAMDEVANGTLQYCHYKIYDSSPASHTYDMDDEGNDNNIMAGYFTFTFNEDTTSFFQMFD